MSEDHNRWIISGYRFHEHQTIEAAERELERLSKKCPDKHFHLYRIKQIARVEPINPKRPRDTNQLAKENTS